MAFGRLGLVQQSITETENKIRAYKVLLEDETVKQDAARSSNILIKLQLERTQLQKFQEKLGALTTQLEPVAKVKKLVAEKELHEKWKENAQGDKKIEAYCDAGIAERQMQLPAAIEAAKPVLVKLSELQSDGGSEMGSQPGPEAKQGSNPGSDSGAEYDRMREKEKKAYAIRLERECAARLIDTLGMRSDQSGNSSKTDPVSDAVAAPAGSGLSLSKTQAGSA